MTTVFLHGDGGKRDDGQARPVAVGGAGFQPKVACRKKNLGFTELLAGLSKLVLELFRIGRQAKKTREKNKTRQRRVNFLRWNDRMGRNTPPPPAAVTFLLFVRCFFIAADPYHIRLVINCQ